MSRLHLAMSDTGGGTHWAFLFDSKEEADEFTLLMGRLKKPVHPTWNTLEWHVLPIEVKTAREAVNEFTEWD